MIILTLDDYSNFPDSYSNLTDFKVTGSTINAEGLQVKVTLNNEVYLGLIELEKFSVTIPAEDIVILEDNYEYKIYVEIEDELGDIHTQTQNIFTSKLNLKALHQIHAMNVYTTPERRFISDDKVKSIDASISELYDLVDAIARETTSDGFIYTTKRLEIIDDEATLPKRCIGNIIHNTALIYDDLITNVATEYTCSTKDNGFTLTFDPNDDLSGKFVIVSYFTR